MKPPRKRRVWLALGGVGVALLAAGVFTLGSLNIPLHLESGNEFVILFALSTFIVVALLVFGLVLTRSLLRLWAERRAGQLGSRFKSKMVLGAMGVSLLPVVFLFFVSYALVNRTLTSWFPRPLEIANEQSRNLLGELEAQEEARLTQRAEQAAAWLKAGRGRTLEAFRNTGGDDGDALWITNSKGRITEFDAPATPPPHRVRTMAGGTELWSAGEALYAASGIPFRGGSLFAARRLPSNFLRRLSEIETQRHTYGQQRQHLRAYKSEILLGLLLITLLVLFATTWAALFLSKQVTVPIQALAEATQEITHGNLDYRVRVQAQDELGTLVASFNQMTAQLAEGRGQINEFTRNLQLAFEERERRHKMMEAILENIPTGVVSLGPDGAITRMNSAVTAIFGDHARQASSIADLVGERAGRGVLQLMRRSLRMGVASRELEIAAGGRLLHLAVTVSSLGLRKSNPGFVIVIDDLTELLRAQKAAAWQEVAQRIAHEIKNPLTPIQLSAQRLLRHLERDGSETPSRELASLVADCAGLIEREVQTLKGLVDEFSQFARFPTARLGPADLNAIVRSALEVFHGRLEGVALEINLAANLPPMKVDSELLRRVLVNLIDNAAEALEDSALRQLKVVTRLSADRETAEIEVADSGPGISPEDKDKLFLPHFSTKDRGTGLGLAIANRIVAEHHGTLRVEDNIPTGARLIVRLPVAEIPAAQESPAS